MRNNGHHLRQEIEAINKFLSNLIPAFKGIRDALINARKAIKRFHETIPDEIKRADKYKQN